MPFHQSNVAILNAATGKADRVGIKVLADVQRRRNQGGITMARLQQHYREKVAAELTAKFGYTSPMQVP
eukprot:gene12350-15090_t